MNQGLLRHIAALDKVKHYIEHLAVQTGECFEVATY